MFRSRSRPNSVTSSSRPGSKEIDDPAEVELIDFSSRRTSSSEFPSVALSSSVETSSSTSDSLETVDTVSTSSSEAPVIIGNHIKPKNPFYTPPDMTPVKPARKRGTNPFLNMDNDSDLVVTKVSSKLTNLTMLNPNMLQCNVENGLDLDISTGRPHSFPSIGSKPRNTTARWSFWSK